MKWNSLFNKAAKLNLQETLKVLWDQIKWMKNDDWKPKVVIGLKKNRLCIMPFLKNLKKNLMKKSPGGNGRFLRPCLALYRQETQISVGLTITKWPKALRILGWLLILFQLKTSSWKKEAKNMARSLKELII